MVSKNNINGSIAHLQTPDCISQKIKYQHLTQILHMCKMSKIEYYLAYPGDEYLLPEWHVKIQIMLS